MASGISFGAIWPPAVLFESRRIRNGGVEAAGIHHERLEPLGMDKNDTLDILYFGENWNNPTK